MALGDSRWLGVGPYRRLVSSVITEGWPGARLKGETARNLPGRGFQICPVRVWLQQRSIHLGLGISGSQDSKPALPGPGAAVLQVSGVEGGKRLCLYAHGAAPASCPGSLPVRAGGGDPASLCAGGPGAEER